jgi:hypothetical protein
MIGSSDETLIVVHLIFQGYSWGWDSSFNFEPDAMNSVED